MKYKKLIIALSCLFGVFVVAIILCFTLFRVKNVELCFKNETVLFANEETQKTVIDSGKISRSQTIFGVNKSKIANTLEKENPYLKIINIESNFPNRLTINCAEREETFCIKIGENLFYICDDEFKVLTLATTFENSQSNAILLSGVNVENKTAKVGEFLTFSNSENLLKSISDSLLLLNRRVSDQRAIFKEISLSFGMNYYTAKSEAILTFVNFDNFEIVIDLPEKMLSQKLAFGLALVPESTDYYLTHYLKIEINPNNTADKKITWVKKTTT